MTSDYYEHNTEKFCEETFNIDMTSIYKPFLSRLKQGASILDAGCGSGRDSRYFTKQGYKVTAFDASPKIVERARELTGLNIQIKEFKQVDEVNVYDGIWTCASLLHIPLVDLPNIMNKLAHSLKKNGVWYLSFKYGYGEREKDGRHFTDLNEDSLKMIVDNLGDISIATLWTTKDKRPQRDDLWLNTILIKQNKENSSI